MSLPDLALAQTSLLEKIKNSYTNYLRQYKNDMDLGSIESRIMQLDSIWKKYQLRHQEILELKIDENKTHHYYSKPDQSLDFVEESYYDNYGKLLQCELNITSQNLNVSVVQPEPFLQPTHRKMPAIQLPKFDGRPTQWSEFRDLFKALDADSHYSGVEKLSYLKECLSGEPLSLIKTIAETEPNFVVTWNKLVKQYDNNETIIYAHINCIISAK